MRRKSSQCGLAKRFDFKPIDQMLIMGKDVMSPEQCNSPEVLSIETQAVLAPPRFHLSLLHSGFAM
jgi:hypothetical protein